MLSDLGMTRVPSLSMKDKVCAAGLLYIGAGCGIKEHVFIIVAVLMCGYIGMQAHRIVQTSLDMSGSMRCLRGQNH